MISEGRAPCERGVLRPDPNEAVPFWHNRVRRGLADAIFGLLGVERKHGVDGHPDPQISAPLVVTPGASTGGREVHQGEGQR